MLHCGPVVQTFVRGLIQDPEILDQPSVLHAACAGPGHVHCTRRASWEHAAWGACTGSALCAGLQASPAPGLAHVLHGACALDWPFALHRFGVSLCDAQHQSQGMHCMYHTGPIWEHAGLGTWNWFVGMIQPTAWCHTLPPALWARSV